MSTTIHQSIENVRRHLGELENKPWPPEQHSLIAQAQEEIAHAFDELAAIQARHETLLESFPDHIFVLDRDGTYLDSNNRVSQFQLEHGQSLIGRHLRDVYAERPELVEFYQQQLEHVFATGQAVSFEHSLFGPDGEQRHLDTLYPIWQDGQVQAVGGICHDVTRLKRMEQIVHESEAQHRQAQQGLEQRNRDQAQLYRVSQTLTATLDLRQVMRRLLQAVTDMLNTQGGSVWLWDKEHPGELVCQAAFHPNLEHLLVGLRLQEGLGLVGWVAHQGKSALVPNTSGDARFYPGVDTQIGFQTVSLLAVPLRVRDAVIGVLEVVNKQGGEFDDHDLALIETLAGPASIAIDNALLVEALRDLASTLQARNKDLDAFAHTVAHDFKHPLTLIVGFADALLHDRAIMPPEQLERALQNILQSGNQMNNIVDELMLLAQLRKTEQQSVPLDMARIVAQAQQRLADMIEQYHAGIVTPPALAWPTALGYAPWVEEVWVNYLSNAIKYGGRSPQVELGADQQTEPRTNRTAVRFWVRDNGDGLAPNDQARLFTAFTRLDQVRVKGHGLGLSIVQRIVEKLGGQVGVESPGVPGQGCLFFFTLPEATGSATH